MNLCFLLHATYNMLPLLPCVATRFKVFRPKYKKSVPGDLSFINPVAVPTQSIFMTLLLRKEVSVGTPRGRQVALTERGYTINSGARARLQ